jgi:peptide-methionine (R)-S-oxide reductase
VNHTGGSDQRCPEPNGGIILKPETNNNQQKRFGRRRLLQFGVGAGLTYGVGFLFYSSSTTALQAAQDESAFEVNLSVKEWKQRLSPDRYAVLREEATERRYSSDLLDEKRSGNYHCAGCDLATYPSKTKYDSGTGWPSFWDALPDAIATREDGSLFLMRTEVHCRRCGSHFGHIFNDGPQPTGKRHCLNGLALVFKAAIG